MTTRKRGNACNSCPTIALDYETAVIMPGRVSVGGLVSNSGTSRFGAMVERLPFSAVPRAASSTTIVTGKLDRTRGCLKCAKPIGVPLIRK